MSLMSLIDENDTIMDDFLAPSFKYYQNREFHKLVKKKKKRKKYIQSFPF